METATYSILEYILELKLAHKARKEPSRPSWGGMMLG